jgi:hypothetical protein
MLELLAESALRSVLLGVAASLGLKILRVRHRQLQITAWTIEPIRLAGNSHPRAQDESDAPDIAFPSAGGNYLD